MALPKERNSLPFPSLPVVGGLQLLDNLLQLAVGPRGVHNCGERLEPIPIRGLAEGPSTGETTPRQSKRTRGRLPVPSNLHLWRLQSDMSMSEVSLSIF